MNQDNSIAGDMVMPGKLTLLNVAEGVPPTQCESPIDAIRFLLKWLTDEEREDIFSGDGKYCRWCGVITNGINCHCENEE